MRDWINENGLLLALLLTVIFSNINIDVVDKEFRELQKENLRLKIEIMKDHIELHDLYKTSCEL